MTQPASDSRPERLLLVEDDQFSQELIVLYLRKAGFTDVVVAADGRQALDLAKATPFDLILLDLNLPRLSGTEVLRRLTKDGHLSDTPVVVISSLTNMEETVLCLDLGAADYLPKPFNARLLEGRVNDCLERHRLRKQVQAVAERTGREREAARLLLQAMASPVLPPPGPSFPVRHAIGYDPAPGGGGDFLDLFALRDGGVAVLTGTAAGDGLSAPLAAARIVTLVRQAVDRAGLEGSDPDPASILQQLNAAVCGTAVEGGRAEGGRVGTAATLFCLFDPQTGLARIANAGHADILAVGPARGVTPVPAPCGRPLGLTAEAVYTTHPFQLLKNETLVALSDGVVEATDAASNRLGEQRLRKLLDGLAGVAPSQLVTSLRQEVAAFVDSAPLALDRSIVALRRVED
ncbi:PP2C family protein-serine/threonine phosphatase [Azospirillum sp. B506]|uniref:PP2C family protein-serine/threonine phosphatase n=1 Tax=Azospirillum sp. B506 TaxID=137721 RepID=UPI00034AB027|nr:SpoIIE family protein phosphatase [Azospirillum sp. B506]